MLKTDEIELQGTTFLAQQLPAMRAYRLLAKLLKVAGPALAALASLDQGTQIQEALPLIAGAFGSLEPDDAAGLALELLAGTTARWTDSAGKNHRRQLGAQASIDEVFTGRLRDMLHCLWQSIKLNYSDFMRGGSLPAPVETTTGGPAAP